MSHFDSITKYILPCLTYVFSTTGHTTDICLFNTLHLFAIRISGKAAQGGFPSPLGLSHSRLPGLKSDNPRGGILEKIGVQGWF